MGTTDEEPLAIAVTLNDQEWASIVGLLGATLQLHKMGIAIGQESALKLVDKIEYVRHAHDVIQQAVMDAFVQDVVAHFEFPPAEPGK